MPAISKSGGSPAAHHRAATARGGGVKSNSSSLFDFLGGGRDLAPEIIPKDIEGRQPRRRPRPHYGDVRVYSPRSSASERLKDRLNTATPASSATRLSLLVPTRADWEPAVRCCLARSPAKSQRSIPASSRLEGVSPSAAVSLISAPPMPSGLDHKPRAGRQALGPTRRRRKYLKNPTRRRLGAAPGCHGRGRQIHALADPQHERLAMSLAPQRRSQRIEAVTRSGSDVSISRRCVARDGLRQPIP